jgi:hypothetical protein
MKLFSTLFLTLTLLASSANAVLNRYNLPTEMPTDLQDKLAWGLMKLDKQVVTEALDAGANAYQIEISETWTSSVDDESTAFLSVGNAYELALSGEGEGFQFQQIIGEAEATKIIPLNDMAVLAQQLRRLLEIYELLIEKGVSVDIKVYIPYLNNGSLRDFIKDIIIYFSTDDVDHAPEYKTQLYVKEYRAYWLNMIKHLQLVIDKHQPEVKP